jgi:hypothetical protein
VLHELPAEVGDNRSVVASDRRSANETSSRLNLLRWLPVSATSTLERRAPLQVLLERSGYSCGRGLEGVSRD